MKCLNAGQVEDSHLSIWMDQQYSETAVERALPQIIKAEVKGYPRHLNILVG